jgi:hypothetical protein
VSRGVIRHEPPVCRALAAPQYDGAKSDLSKRVGAVLPVSSARECGAVGGPG